MTLGDAKVGSTVVVTKGTAHTSAVLWTWESQKAVNCISEK